MSWGFVCVWVSEQKEGQRFDYRLLVCIVWNEVVVVGIERKKIKPSQSKKPMVANGPR